MYVHVWFLVSVCLDIAHTPSTARGLGSLSSVLHNQTSGPKLTRCWLYTNQNTVICCNEATFTPFELQLPIYSTDAAGACEVICRFEM